MDLGDWGNESGFAPFDSASENPSFGVNQPVKNPKSKKAKKAKSGKGGKGIIAVVAVVLVAVVALGVIFWGNISRFFQRNFGDPTAYLQDVEKDNVAAAADDFAAAYDQMMTGYAVQNPSANYTLTLEVSDTMISLLETSLASEGMNVDLSWVENITLSPRVEMYENTLRYDIGVGLNSTTLATVSMIWDVESGMIYVGIPELHDTYIAIDTYEMFGYGANDVAEAMAMSQALTQTFVEALPESEDMKELIVKYMGIVIDSFSDAEKEKRSVEVDGLEQDLMVVSVDLSQKDILKLVIDILEEAKDDKLVEDILNDFEDAMVSLYGYELGLYESFSYGVEGALEDLEYGLDEVGTTTFLTIDTYIDSKDIVVGRTITVKEGREKISFYYITITEGDEWAFEAEAGELFISGSGTVNGDARSGSYTVSVSGTDYVTVKLDNCVTSGSAFTGTIRIIPESVVYDMAGLSGPYSSILNQAALALSFTNNSVTVGIETAGTTFVAFTLSGEVSEAKPIALPASFDVNDDSAGMKWVSELDLEAVLANLNKAGVPSAYLDAAEQLVDMFYDEFT